MPRANITLHLGMPKCASTALQLHFWKHRKWLEKQGVLYPEPIESTSVPKQQSLVRQLLGKGLDICQLEALASEEKNILLSTEGLTNHFYDFPKTNLEKAARFFSGQNTTGLLILRPQRAWIKSYYIQCTLNPPSKIASHYSTFLNFSAFSRLPIVASLADRDQLSRDLSSAFGLSKLVHIEQSSDLLSEIETKAGIPRPPGSNLTRSNSSPQSFIIEIIRQMNAFEEVQADRNIWLGAIQEWAGTNNTIMKMYRSQYDLEAISSLEFRLFDRLSPNKCSDFSLSESQIEELKTWASKLKSYR